VIVGSKIVDLLFKGEREEIKNMIAASKKSVIKS